MADSTVTTPDRRARIAALGYDYSAQRKDVIEHCNLCGASSLVVLTHVDRYGFPAQAHACSECGLVFLNPRMDAQAYGRFYDGVYRPLVSAFHGRLIDARTIQAEQREYAIERAGFLRPFVAGRGYQSMLDIGGSTGVVAHHFAEEFGLRGTLIDPAPLEVEQARQLGLETITGLIEEFDFGSRRFDVVIICQTVDHLLDVSGTLHRVRDLLTPNGLLFVDIVDFRAAYLRNWSVEAAVKIDHPYYLTESTMKAYLARAGFAVLRTDYAADHLHISYACQPGVRTEPVSGVASAGEMLREVRFVQNAPR
ncbi:MAG: class I SAM-dependent methyltransferase [Vicinamibacterales bacterium]